MSGVSHMLPFVIGGGILIAIAFLLDDFTIDPSNFGMNTPIAAFFKTVGGVAFGLMLPVLAGFIAYSIADRPGLAVGFVGGMLASTGNSILEFTNSYSGGINGYLANTVFNSPGTTVSGFLGALVAGFCCRIYCTIAKKIFSKLPESLEGIKSDIVVSCTWRIHYGCIDVVRIQSDYRCYKRRTCKPTKQYGFSIKGYSWYCSRRYDGY